MDFTSLARIFLNRRVNAARTWTGDGIRRVQEKQLQSLLRQGAKTDYLAKFGLNGNTDYRTFRDTVPVVAYPDLRPWIMRMVNGERNVLWPGKTRRFAQSSGTSDGKSKYIPVTDDSLRLNHYRGASDAVAHYLHNYPDSRLFAGKGFILGGSFANELAPHPGVYVGDLSANLIDNISPLVNLFRVPSKKIALMPDWRTKVPALVKASRNAHITNISGVPSWFMTVIKEVIRDAGATTIHDVWSDLEVFFHGGISMAPYRDQYARLTDPARMRYVETYNASEGFFAVQDLKEPGAMLLLLDVGVFYEFIPLDQTDVPHPAGVRTAADVEQDKVYALVITAANGLWRYAIGDTVRIVSTDPLRIAIAGRTKNFINAFGEEVMVHNTDAAIAAACAQTGAAVRDYHVAPVFATAATPDEPGHRGRHQWLIEWTKAPADTENFAEILDHALQAENSDYQAKRSGGIFLDRLTITTVPEGTFDRWLQSTGKLGGQRKVPRLSNTRSTLDAILAQTTDPQPINR